MRSVRLVKLVHRHASCNLSTISLSLVAFLRIFRMVFPARLRITAVSCLLLLTFTACNGDESSTTSLPSDTTQQAGGDESSTTSQPSDTTQQAGGDETTSGGDESSMTVRLLTHDSFQVSEETFDAFTDSTGITVEQLSLGDAGEMLSQALLTAGDPLGDVLFGIDNTSLQRGLDGDIFEPYQSPGLADVEDRFKLDPNYRVTPIDYGDVCLNYWAESFGDNPPESLDDLTDPAFKDQLVVQNPETSSPGLAFMLATIAHYGDDWETYWTDLRANGVAVTSGWTEAYYTRFIAHGGDRAIVVSYASSPPAEVYYSDPPVDNPPTGVVTASCYRQIEFAGILAGAENVDAARQLIDFMLTPQFQNDIPLNMFVFPVTESAELPEVFVEHAQIAEDPFMLDPEQVELKRNEWIDRWVEIVLR